MTADGILYVDEYCFELKDDLDKMFGLDKWEIHNDKYGDIWDLSKIPPTMIVDVVDENDKVIGNIIIKNKYEQVYDQIQDCMYLEPYPDEIEIKILGE